MNENIPFVGVGPSVDVVERVSEVETATPEVQVDPEPLSEVVRPVNAARSAAGRRRNGFRNWFDWVASTNASMA